MANFAEDAKLKDQGCALPEGVYFMKQTIGNACGTIGALHAIANNQDKLLIGKALSCCFQYGTRNFHTLCSSLEAWAHSRPSRPPLDVWKVYAKHDPACACR